MMEHRLDNRIHTPINVTIHTDKGDAFKARANNLSRGGVNIDLEEIWVVEVNKLVIMEFMEERLHIKIPALVLQTSENSASLMFIEHSPELHSFLSDLNR